jgi:D-glucuronyl C5-epimerase C-terminus
MRPRPCVLLCCAAALAAGAGGPMADCARAAHPARELSLGPLGRGQAPAPRARVRPRARAASSRARSAAHGPSVGAVLKSLLRAGQISEAQYARYRSAYVSAKRSLAHLSGTRAAELGAVLGNVQSMAAAGALGASTLPAAMFTLERNRAWWTGEPLLSGDVRVSVPHSMLVWEHYPGQGIQIQWLATFGKANGFYLSGHENANLRALLAEAIPLAGRRAGGIAWEYLFPFDGGRPPWTSGLSQGTALQVLARAYSRFHEAGYLTAAQQALGIFQTPPPHGVRVHTRAGAEYAEYTYAPRDRILNGFIQALVGLYDYTSITQDPLGQRLFEEGDAEARAEVPHYDTGHWSRYDQYGESDLNYHELLTEFLQHLCERTRRGEPLLPAQPPPPAPTTPTTPTAAPTTPTPPPASGASGGSAPPAGASARIAAAHRAQAVLSPAPAGDAIYCSTAQRFQADERTPPLISLLTRSLRTGTRGGVQMSLSKISTVHLTIRRRGRVVWTNAATVEGGRPKLLWVTPGASGSYSVTLTATDLAGNFSTAHGSITLTRH